MVHGLKQVLNTAASCFEASVQYTVPEDGVLEDVLAGMQSLLAAWGDYDM